MRTTQLTFLAALFCFIMLGCTNQPQTIGEQIDHLKKQVTSDTHNLQVLANEDFPKIQQDFHYCDSMLQYLDAELVEASFEQLNLTQAYIHQFKETKPIMEKKMDYLLEQLDNLKQDAETHYLSDSLVSVYLQTETKVADTLHAQVEYFKDRFGECQESLNKLKKNKQ